jgi:hypothetical protein
MTRHRIELTVISAQHVRLHKVHGQLFSQFERLGKVRYMDGSKMELLAPASDAAKQAR